MNAEAKKSGQAVAGPESDDNGTVTPGRGQSAKRILEEFAGQQATGQRHVVVLLGAGASRAAGVPDLAQLEGVVREALKADFDDVIHSVFAGGINLEGALTRLRRLQSVLGTGDELQGITATRAAAIERLVTETIIAAISESKIDPSVFDGFAAWAVRQDRSDPLEVFTLNYDLLIEDSLERLGANYFDGFVGSVRARFHDYLVDSATENARYTLSPLFIRVWKLHGSINWLRDPNTNEIIRLGTPVPQGQMAAIYPSEEKYIASRRVPFLVLHDRLRHSLAQPETLLIVSGYSFADEHLNEVIFDTLTRRPRSGAFVFCHGEAPKLLRDRLPILPNVIVTTPHSATVAGSSFDWAPGDDISGAFEAGAFRLGNFGALSRYLASLVPQTTHAGS